MYCLYALRLEMTNIGIYFNIIHDSEVKPLDCQKVTDHVNFALKKGLYQKGPMGIG